MKTYHKIQTIWLRDPATKHKTLLEGVWARPEFAYLSETMWEFTEKVDGTNIRVHWDAQQRTVAFAGRTDNAQTPAFLLAALEALFPVAKLAEVLECDATLYGEGYGARIQKGGGSYIADGCSFILFDVHVGEMWLKREDVYDVATRLGIRHVPPVGHGTLLDAIERVRGGLNSTLRATQAEGLVVRPMVELSDRRGVRVIAKIKCKDFASS